MRQRGIGLVALAAFLAQTLFVPAESTIDALDHELVEVKKQHQDAVTQGMANFLSQLEAASATPDAAISLYQLAGGAMPPATPVTKVHQVETQDEKAARDAQDQANATGLAAMAQLHCGLMRYAALLTTSPDQKGLKEDWLAWLKTSAAIYAQIKPPATTIPAGNPGQGQGRRRGGWNQNEAFQLVGELKGKSVSNSPISDYLGFQGWNDSEQSNWSVKQMPDLYRTLVLEPSRATPTADTLAAWDVFIAMKSADQTDADYWDQVELPSFMFERACDDYAISHSMDKLQVLLQIIQANPTHPKLDGMISRAHELVADYRSRHGGPPVTPSPGATTNAATPDPNVTTTTDGQMTIVTLHPATNAPGGTAPAPQTPVSPESVAPAQQQGVPVQTPPPVPPPTTPAPAPTATQ